MKKFLFLWLIIPFTPFIYSQIPVSQIEGYLEVYHPTDFTSMYIGKRDSAITENGNKKYNTFVGSYAGSINSVGFLNTFIGWRSGNENTSGDWNTIVGGQAGRYANGNYNTFLGSQAGIYTTSGQKNTFLGFAAGNYIQGNNNISIGHFSGPNFGETTTVNDRLFIDVSPTEKPLIYGEFDNDVVQINGKLVTGIPGDNQSLLTLNSERSWVFKQFGSGSSTGLKLTALNSSNNNKDFIIDTEGKVGIGPVASPGLLQERLHVNGDAYKSEGGGSWSTPSDERLKKDIQFFNLGLQVIEQIQPVSFYYNGKLQIANEKKQIGVIAQELMKLMPEMVSSFVGEDGETYLKVNPGAFDFLLINAVKELNTRFEKKLYVIEKEINELKTALTNGQ